MDPEEVGTGGRADLRDLPEWLDSLDSGAVDAGDLPKWLESIHDFVWDGDDE